MTTRFITINVPLRSPLTQLQRTILMTLQEHGEPLRWAIVAVNSEQQLVQVEAVVTVDTLKDLAANRPQFSV